MDSGLRRNDNSFYREPRAPWLEEKCQVFAQQHILIEDDLAPRNLPVVRACAIPDPAQLFVQNRTVRSFEIHALPGLTTGRPQTVHCGYQIVGRRLGRAR